MTSFLPHRWTGARRLGDEWGYPNSALVVTFELNK